MSQKDSGYERKERDLYETPEWVTEALCKHLARTNTWHFGGVWEPAAGSGKMSRVLANWVDGRSYGNPCVFSSDIEPLAEGIVRQDFLTAEWPKRPSNVGAIVTNPPFDLAVEFIETALRHVDRQGHGLVAMLLRTDFDHAKSRSHLFRDCPVFQRKLVLTKRIVWFEPEPGQKGKSPSFNHAWFIWNAKHSGWPQIGYAP